MDPDTDPAAADPSATLPSSAGAAVRFLPRGTNLGPYVVLEPLGAGGMGAVYAAYDATLDRKVAVKVLHTGGSGSSADLAERLVREARAMARISHHNVLAVYELGVHEGDHFIAMELVEGWSLGDWLTLEKRGWQQVLEMFRYAGRGLAAAHAAQLIHRDFKPANVLVSADGRVRVTDFGLVRLRDDRLVPRSPQTTPLSATETLTQAGAILGTPRYMAPEQLADGAATEASDQYSFCVALYEALYGAPPFAGDTLASRMEAMNAGRVVRPARSPVPRFVFEAIARGLRRDPAQRWPSMNALLAELGRDVLTPRRRALGAAALVGALLLSGGTFWISEEHGRRRCATAARAIEEVWADPDRAALRARFAKLPAADAPDWAERAISRLDEFGRDWSQARGEVCRLERLDAPVAQTLQRRSCLELRRRELSSLVRLLVRADARLSQRAVVSAMGLTPVGSCADPSAITPGLISDPRTLELAGQLSELNAEHLAVGGTSVLTRVREVLKAAQAAELPALEAEALALEGRVLSFAGQPREADEVFKRGILKAHATRHLALEARLWIYLAQSLAVDQGRIPEAKEAMAFAEAAGIAMGEPAQAQLQARVVRSLVRWMAREIPEAIEDARAAVDLAERLPAERARMHQYRNNLGGLLLESGDLAGAAAELERSLEEAEALLGPNHPHLIESWMNLSLVYSAQPSLPPSEAEQAARRALTLAERAYGPDNLRAADALGNLAVILAAQRRFDQVAEYADRAAALYRGGGIEHGPALSTLVVGARAAVHRGKLEKAEALLREADRLAARLQAGDPAREINRELAWAAYERRRDQPRRALVHADRALVALAQVPADRLLEGRSRFERAQALAGAAPRRRAESVAEAERARTALASAGYDAEAAEVADWLRRRTAQASGPP